ncbi:hypothetical protein LIER_25130 [Lithospermum erythrorhizon]|uniref:Mitochondrial protein n=1 Tax=Lithospermum erythrorhizon TaxID=34254 RepID=A0AAV3R6L9_LITER
MQHLDLVSYSNNILSKQGGVPNSESVLGEASSSDTAHVLPSTHGVVNHQRQSTRNRQPAKWMNDYVLNSISTDCALPQFSTSHMDFLAKLLVIPEPHTYKEASQHIEWQAAMDAEIQALETNKTWIIADLPDGHKPIGCKWVYKPDGSVDKCKVSGQGIQSSRRHRLF